MPHPNRTFKIVIAPDSFKSTATTSQAAAFIAEGIQAAVQSNECEGINVEITTVPMADGGEGTSSCFEGIDITLPTTDANGRLTEATYRFDPQSETAYIDVAAASGLPAVEDELRPLTADTYGTGVLIADAQTRGARRIILGLGGTATTDAGTGILVALGATPMNKQGLPLRQGGGALGELDYLDTAQVNIPAAAMSWVLLTDVNSPATGPEGTAHTFAAQKGASEEDIAMLENGIATICAVSGVDPTTPGLGAAGGLPIGITWLSSLIHGNNNNVVIMPGAQVVANACNLEEHIANADLVITGEGRLDHTSFNTKVVGTIARLAAQHQVDMMVLAGSVEPSCSQQFDHLSMTAVELPDFKEHTSVRDQIRFAAQQAFTTYALTKTVQG